MKLSETTTLIADAMKKDTPPWRIPLVQHQNSGFPTNAYTNRQYGGINPLLLNVVAMKRGYRSKYWATFKQWQGLGCKIKQRPEDVPEGEWGTKITRMEYQEGTEQKVPKTVFLFNAGQVFGNFQLKPATAYQVLLTEVSNNAPDYGPVDEIIGRTGNAIKHGNYKEPRYERPPKDYICMPWRKRFATDSQYYGSVLHELIHYVEWRTGWKGSEEQGELIAEIGQAYLETLLGIPHCNDLTNYHKWLDGWLAAMNADPRFIYEAAAQAEKAVDFVLGRNIGRE